MFTGSVTIAIAVADPGAVVDDLGSGLEVADVEVEALGILDAACRSRWVMAPTDYHALCVPSK